MIKFDHFPERWLKVVDAMTEKRKGPRAKKLRMLKIKESDAQLIMRMFFGNRMENKVKEEKRLSK